MNVGDSHSFHVPRPTLRTFSDVPRRTQMMMEDDHFCASFGITVPPALESFVRGMEFDSGLSFSCPKPSLLPLPVVESKQWIETAVIPTWNIRTQKGFSMTEWIASREKEEAEAIAFHKDKEQPLCAVEKARGLVRRAVDRGNLYDRFNALCALRRAVRQECGTRHEKFRWTDGDQLDWNAMVRDHCMHICKSALNCECAQPHDTNYPPILSTTQHASRDWVSKIAPPQPLRLGYPQERERDYIRPQTATPSPSPAMYGVTSGSMRRSMDVVVHVPCPSVVYFPSCRCNPPCM
jgi:hypothetical protein